MTINILFGALCLLIAGALFLSFLHDVILWAYREGRERGRGDAEKWWMEQGKTVDQARQEIWREESKQ